MSEYVPGQGVGGINLLWRAQSFLSLVVVLLLWTEDGDGDLVRAIEKGAVVKWKNRMGN